MSPTQDLPPAEGFSAIPYKRHLPRRGPPNWMIVAGIVAYVFIVMPRFQKRYYIERELNREEKQFEILVGTLLMGEKDLKFLRRRYELLKFAKENNLNVDFEFYKNPRYDAAAVPLF